MVHKGTAWRLASLLMLTRCPVQRKTSEVRRSSLHQPRQSSLKGNLPCGFGTLPKGSTYDICLLTEYPAASRDALATATYRAQSLQAKTKKTPCWHILNQSHEPCVVALPGMAYINLPYLPVKGFRALRWRLPGRWADSKSAGLLGRLLHAWLCSRRQVGPRRFADWNVSSGHAHAP